MKKKKINFRIFLIEVFSIFIGITSAFWLDNWNKNRLQKREEIKILQELKNGLKSTLSDMKSNVQGHQTSINASFQLMKFINGELESTDSVRHYYQLATIDYTFTPNTGAYETLKSRGVQLITNDSIRLSIISLHDFTFKAMVRLEEEEEAFEFFKNYSPILVERFSKMKISYYRNNFIASIDYPPNYEPRKDHEFMFISNKMINSRAIIQNFYNRNENIVEKLIESIDTELQTLLE